MAPAVAFLAPDHVGLRGVAHHDHRFDARRQGDEAGGNRDPHPRGISGADPPFRAQINQRPAHAAHHVRTVNRDLAAQRLAHRIDDGGRVSIGQTHVEAREDRERGRHRHEIVERGIGIGVLEPGDLCVAIGTVGCHDHPRAGIGDPVGQGLVGKAAEHGGVDHAHPLGGLGPVNLRYDARHVQCHAVARLQSQRLERDRAFRHFEQQALAADREAIERRALAAVGRHVPAVALEHQRGLIAVA